MNAQVKLYNCQQNAGIPGITLNLADMMWRMVLLRKQKGRQLSPHLATRQQGNSDRYEEVELLLVKVTQKIIKEK